MFVSPRPRLVGAVAVVMVCGSRFVHAQTPSGGSLRGYVTDDQKAAVRDVAIAATSPDAPGTYTAASDEQGYYRLLDLPPGTYTITAKRDGFAAFVRENIVIRAGTNLGLDITMKIGTIAESVVVNAETPMLESRSFVQAINISGDLQRAVPLSGRRNWADSLLLAPGVVSQETNNNTQFYFVHGADVSSNSFHVDGADVMSSTGSSPRFVNLSPEVIQDIQIKGGAVDASTPLGLGAAFNVTTKSGTNEVRGSASLVFRPERWNDNNVAGGTTSKTSFTQPEFAIGGPIVKDRWWVFGSYRRLHGSTGISRTAGQLAALQNLVRGFAPFDLADDANVYFAKTSAAMGQSHRISGSYQRDPYASDSAAADVAVPSSNIRGGNGVEGRVQSVLTGSLTTQISVSYNDKGLVTQAKSADQPARVAFQSTALSGGRLVGVGRLAGYGASATSSSVTQGEKLTIAAAATFFKQAWQGSHQIEAGVYSQPRLANRLRLDYVNGGAAVEDRVVLDRADLSRGTRVFHTLVYDNAQQQSSDLTGSDNALYVQDGWNPVPSLTVNAGVRVDFIRRKDNIFDRATQRSHDIGPRVGVSYTITDDGRNVVRVSWTRVHETLTQNWISLGSSAAGFTDRYDFDGDGTLETAFVTAPSTALNSALVLDTDHFHQPRADQWNAGFRRQFTGRVAVDVGFTSRELKDGVAYLETNAIYETGIFKGYRNETLLSIFKVTNNTWNWQAVRELELTVTKQTERTQLIATYTRQWRHLGGSWQPNDPASIIQPSAFPDNRGIGRQNDSGGGPNQNGLSGSALAEYFGPAAQWRDHVARIAASYVAPGNITLAADATIQSGPWSGPVVTRLPALDPSFGPATVRLSNGQLVPNPLATFFRFVGSTRSDGQFTLPAYRVLNLRVGKTFTLTAVKVNLALEGFNVTNGGAPLALAFGGGNQVGSVNFKQGTSVQLPRSMQFFVRATF